MKLLTIQEVKAELDAGRSLLLCMPWEKRSQRIQCVQRSCIVCNLGLCMEAANADAAAALGLLTVCLDCRLLLAAAYPEELANPGRTQAKFLIGGAQLSFEEAKKWHRALTHPERPS